ncbi:Uncharacterised protein [Buttiauxella agrestis]|uniref:Rap1a immunity protein domain-containing protein n=1 Tax=Buttiauxella agrestis TaxID=82977 RepID=A0A381C8C7_9ENTR|nr:Rap1a/Tai family immunity protein [Buttiauxella agrestis]SUW64154.1 Uncharacterised protein [Buttiauxella agrestis]
MKALVALVLIFSSAFVHATMREMQTGNDMLYNINQAKKGDSFTSMYISGYMRGISDYALIIGGICPPDGVDMDQYIDIVADYLNKNPINRNEPSSILAAVAMGKAFPCKKK